MGGRVGVALAVSREMEGRHGRSRRRGSLAKWKEAHNKRAAGPYLEIALGLFRGLEGGVGSGSLTGGSIGRGSD